MNYRIPHKKKMLKCYTENKMETTNNRCHTTEEYGRKLRRSSGKTYGEARLKNNPYEVKMSKEDNKEKRYLTLTRIGSNMSSASCLLEHFLYAYKNAPESSIKPSYHYISQAIIHKMQHSF